MLKKLVHSLQFVHAYARLVQDPKRLDVVLALVDKTVDDDADLPPDLRLPPVIAFLGRPPERLELDLDALRALPEGTLGREVAEWYHGRGITPDALARRLDGGEMARFKEHMSRTHDIWHVVTGFDTDVAGEMGLQAFYLAQFGSPVALVLLSAALLETFLHSREDTVRRMDAVTRGWTLGKASSLLVGTDWTALWEMPLMVVRRGFGIAEPQRAGAQGAGAQGAGAQRASA